MAKQIDPPPSNFLQTPFGPFSSSPFGNEAWDFGDGTEKVMVKSDGNVEMHAKDGYAVTQHHFAKAGDYLVRV